MYKDFYGFKSRPFAKTPDPQFLYLSRVHREAFARLLHAVEERDMMLLSGGIGCGKTTLSRALMDALDDSYRIVLLTNPRMSPLELLQTLALRLEIDSPSRNKSELLEQLGHQLYGFYQQKIHPVLIVDEAQLIPHRDVFDEIRLLTNYQLDDVNLISVILMGQPELLKRLSHPIYEPLRQRIGIKFELKSLDADDVAAYLQHRLGCAGGDGNIFSRAAVEQITIFSAGVPRRINQVASLALLEGFGRGVQQIEAEVINSVAEELDGL